MLSQADYLIQFATFLTSKVSSLVPLSSIAETRIHGDGGQKDCPYAFVYAARATGSRDNGAGSTITSPLNRSAAPPRNASYVPYQYWKSGMKGQGKRMRILAYGTPFDSL